MTIATYVLLLDRLKVNNILVFSNYTTISIVSVVPGRQESTKPWTTGEVYPVGSWWRDEGVPLCFHREVHVGLDTNMVSAGEGYSQAFLVCDRYQWVSLALSVIIYFIYYLNNVTVCQFVDLTKMMWVPTYRTMVAQWENCCFSIRDQRFECLWRHVSDLKCLSLWMVSNNISR